MNKYDWDLEPLLGGLSIDDYFKNYVVEIKKLLKIYPSFYSSLPNFKKWLKQNEKCAILGNRLTNYISNKLNENLIDQKYLGWTQKITIVLKEFSNQLADYENIVIAHEKEITEYLSNKDLEEYRRDFNLIFRLKDHILAPEIEKVVDKLSITDGEVNTIFTTLTDSDLKFNSAVDSKGKLHPIHTASDASALLKNKDRVLRKNVWINFHTAYSKYQNTLCQCLYYNYLGLNTSAQVYHFKDYITSSTFADEIDVNFITNLYCEVKGFKPLFQKYRKIKNQLLKEHLKLNKLEPWDLSVDLTSQQIKITIEEAQKMIVEGLAPLGNEFVGHIKEAFKNNWISWLPKPNKLTGAYSIGGVKGLERFYILTNFNGTLESVETIAHELGHSMNSYYSVKHQKVDPETSIFYAEIASITTETLFILNLINKNQKNKKLINMCLTHLFDNFFACTTRQIIFSNFEYLANEKINRGEPFTPQIVQKMYLDLIKEYEGMKDKTFQQYQHEPYKNSLSTILRIPHFYAGNFYVYKYAIGQICGLIVAYRIYHHDQNAVKDFIKFLSSGSSLNKLDTIKLLNIDLTKKTPYAEVLKILSDLLKLFN